MAVPGLQVSCLGIVFVLLHCVSLLSCNPLNNSVTLWAPTRSSFRRGHPVALQQLPRLDPKLYHLRKPAEQSLFCERDLSGVGSLETLCVLNRSVSFEVDSTVVVGSGTLEIQPNVLISCNVPGCNLTILLNGDFNVGANSSIRCGSLWIQAANLNLGDSASLNSTAFGGKPPSGASGTPSGTDGAGGGHGGRGAFCLQDETKEQRDTWGGDSYAWTTLEDPWSFGSNGGTTNENKDFGGKGGGRINVTVTGILVVNGSIEADGGSVGEEGGGGSGGSLYIKASRM